MENIAFEAELAEFADDPQSNPSPVEPGEGRIVPSGAMFSPYLPPQQFASSCHPEERGISSKVTYVRDKNEIPRTLRMTRCAKRALGAEDLDR
jgi:hypothetical protein